MVTTKRPREFVTLMAILMSTVALAIDAVLPALKQIGLDFQISNPNQAQFIIAVLFFAMSFGLLIYGPLSDTIGRKPSILIGLIFFLIGSVTCLLSQSFMTILIGRALQGFGAASCRVVSIAMIRDQFQGAKMAQVMSFIMRGLVGYLYNGTIIPLVAAFLIFGTLSFAVSWHTSKS